MAEEDQSVQSAPLASSARPEVYRYHDYRSFLREWLDFLRATQFGFTQRKLAQNAGLATGYLSMVITGIRHLSSKALAKLLPHLGLNAQERSYLELLLVVGTADSQDVRLDALERMKKFDAYKKHHPKELEVSEYLNHWYYVAIREMAAMPDFRPDPEWIKSRLRGNVSLPEIKTALEFLVRNKHVEICPDGSAKLPEKSLDCMGGVYRIALTQFHREMLALAAKSIETVPSSERMILGHTVALGVKKFEQAKGIMNEALEKIRRLGEAENQNTGDEVFHLEFTMFPLTRSEKK